jgi:hypothetical protein
MTGPMHVVCVDFAVAVRAPGSFVFVDWAEDDPEVVDVPPPLPDFGGDEEPTEERQRTLVGPIVTPRRPAQKR